MVVQCNAKIAQIWLHSSTIWLYDHTKVNKCLWKSLNIRVGFNAAWAYTQHEKIAMIAIYNDPCWLTRMMPSIQKMEWNVCISHLNLLLEGVVVYIRWVGITCKRWIDYDVVNDSLTCCWQHCWIADWQLMIHVLINTILGVEEEMSIWDVTHN